MKNLGKIINYGLILWSLSLFGCNPHTGEKPIYFSGKVINEKIHKRLIGRDTYLFSVNTNEGIKLFKCESSPSKLDVLINPGDSADIKLEEPGYGRHPNDSEFYINIGEIKKVNGKPLGITSWEIE